eukprot:3663327-Rhodomonas_salina.1
MSGTNLAYAALLQSQCYGSAYRLLRSLRGSSLRACYAMSGTDLARGSILLRAFYTVSGTDLAYGATSAIFSALSPPPPLPSISWS